MMIVMILIHTHPYDSSPPPLPTTSHNLACTHVKHISHHTVIELSNRQSVLTYHAHYDVSIRENMIIQSYRSMIIPTLTFDLS